jgi:hypothetical protein
MKNVTLSADEGLLEQARQVARSQRRTLNPAFREWLLQFTAQNGSKKRRNNGRQVLLGFANRHRLGKAASTAYRGMTLWSLPPRLKPAAPCSTVKTCKRGRALAIYGSRTHLRNAAS